MPHAMCRYPYRSRPRALRRLPPNWRKRIEFYKCPDEGFQHEYRVEFKKGRTPIGFGREIGFLTVDMEKEHWVIETEIYDDRMRGRGLGKALYLMAVKHLGCISTIYHHGVSKDAQRVWKSLAKTHRHTLDFWTSRITVYLE